MKPIKKRLMIDIETTSLDVGTSVWEIGYWEIGSDFDDTYGDNHFNGRFILNPYEQERLVDDATIDWLDKNSDSWKNAKVLFDLCDPTKMILDLFQEDVKSEGFDEVWCKGADFDFAILRSLYRQYEIDLPWHYRDQCCMRGFQNTFPEIQMVFTKDESHSAMYDARSQAVCLEKILKEIGRY